MRACVRACVHMRACVFTSARACKKGCPRGDNEGMKSHRFSGNLIKPSGDEDKTIQYVARLQEVRVKARSFDFDNDFLASIRINTRMCTRVCFIHVNLFTHKIIAELDKP